MAKRTKTGTTPLSPLEGEMSPKATEGVTSEGTARRNAATKKMSRAAAATPPDRARSASQSESGHPPLKGEGTVQRRPAHAGRAYSGSAARVEVLPPAERISLRAPAASLSALSKALGVKLPERPKTSASTAGRTALWLGPDEWLIIDEAGGEPLADCAKVTQLHSAVGVSHRNVAFQVSGAGCEAAINAGCPQDLGLAAFPVGACSRTVLGKIEIVLLRTSEDAFRIECWRSFSDYCFTFLADAARDAAA